MKFTMRDLLFFILWGGISVIIFKIINPSNFIGELILMFLIGGSGSVVGGYFKDRKIKKE
ncbi:hypothetical protein [Priestia abyssalis]|uniref:hypothetical protein n=1 Tax=Priestia abyssalis TaxID=1221450 RepID=UPI00099599C2|nr:hypothetical protein [Priestia abyssalis]